MSALYVDPAIGSHNPFYVDFDYPCQESKIIGFKRNTSCLLFLLFYLPASITDKRIPVGQDISCRRSFICHFETLIFVLKKCDISLWLESKTCYFPMWTFSSNVFLPIFRPSGENTELKRSPFQAWSRSVYSHKCYAYCQGVLFCLFLLFQSIHLHFFPKPLLIFSCVGLQNKIGHPAGCRFPCWVPAAYK